MSKPRLEPLDRLPLREQIIAAIRNAIIEGRFLPGSKIPETEIADELGVSRTPIREAFQMLQQQGLIEIRPKSGTFVASLNRAEAEDGLHVRAALEELAVRQAIERHSAVEWRALCERYEALLHQAHRAVADNDPVAGIEFDIAWHSLVIESSKNQSLVRTWHAAGLVNLIWSFEFDLYPLDEDAFKDWVHRHEIYLDVLQRRDLDDCISVVRDHILMKVSDVDDSADHAKPGNDV